MRHYATAAYLALNPTVAALEDEEAAARLTPNPVNEAFLSFGGNPSSSSSDGGGGGGELASSASSFSSSSAAPYDKDSRGPKPGSGSGSGSVSGLKSGSESKSGSGSGSGPPSLKPKPKKVKKKLPPVKKDMEAAEAAAAKSGDGTPYTSWWGCTS